MLLFTFLAGLVIVAIASAWRSDSQVRRLRAELDELQLHMGTSCSRCDLLEESFMKVLSSIRQNAEDIDQLDDDIRRLEDLIQELKKQGEGPPAAA